MARLLTLREFVLRALRVPFVEHGRTYEGWDCWGLVYRAYRDVYGIELPSYAGGYASTEDYRALDAMIRGGLPAWAPAPEPWRPGDMAVFTLGSRWLFHVGLITGPRSFIHAYEPAGCTATAGLGERAWGKRLSGVYRHG